MGPHFFSYSSDGTQLVRRLHSALLDGPKPIKTIAYDEDLLPGENYQRWIAETVPACDTVLFVLTELSATSEQCTLELDRAQDLGIPIFLLVVDDRREPLQLAYRRTRFDFTRHADDRCFEASLAQLRRQLYRLDTPEGFQMLLRRKLEAAERAIRTHKGSDDRLRQFEEYRSELMAQMDELRPAVDAYAAAGLRPSGPWKAREREQPTPKSSVVRSGVRFVHPLPETKPEQFLDRVVERERLTELLRDQELRLLAVVGRHGVGKTATVCSVLRAAGDGEVPLATGVAYRSTRGAQRVTAAALLNDLGALLPEASQPNGIIGNAELTTTQKLSGILHELGRSPVVLALDDAEDLLDDDGDIRDPELGTLLSTLLLPTTHHGVKVVLISDKPPEALLRFPTASDLRIDEGLSADDAWDLLRRLDKTNVLGFRRMKRSTVLRIHDCTGGYPRALELLFAVRKANPFTTTDEVLDALDEHRDMGPESFLLGKLLGLLLSIEQVVVKVLAIFGRPVLPEAVNYLLRWGFPNYDSAEALAKLAERRLVREEDGRYYLPTLDRALVLEQIDLGRPEDREAVPPPFRSFALFHQAAEYFAMRKPEYVQAFDDLDDHLAEVDLRIQAKEYKHAYQLLDDIDSRYLQVWGYSRVLQQYRWELVGLLDNARLEMINIEALAHAEEESDQPGRAREHYETAFAIAEVRNDPRDLKYLHVNLGGSYLKEEMPGRALREFQQALRLVREHGWSDEEVSPLVGISLCLGRMGRFAEAFEHHAQAAAAVRSAHDPRRAAELERNLGMWYGQLGELDQALEHLRRGRGLAQEAGDQLTEAFCVDGMAEVMVDQGRVGRAVALATQALATGERLGSAHLLRESYTTLAFAQLCQGALKDARHAADIACRYGMSRRAIYATFLRGLLALREGDVEAELSFEDVAGRVKALREADGDANYFALDLQGLALCGLIARGRMEHLEEARGAFRAARALTDDPGIVHRTVRLLDELCVDDELSTALRAARDAARNVDAPPSAPTGVVS